MMEIRELKTYLVTANIDRNNWAALQDTGKYMRVDSSRWYYVTNENDIFNKVFEHRAKELEQEFKETINVIHEQLPLL